MKYFIIAPPKAGIHLCGNLFTELGIQNSYYLLRRENSLKYNRNLWNTSITDHGGVRLIEKGWAELIDLMPNDTFTLLQTPYSKKLYDKIKPYKIVYITRPLEDMIKSAKRMKNEKGVDTIKFTNKEIMEKFAPWNDIQNIFHLDFDDLVNSNIEVIDKLQHYLYNRIGFDSKTVITNTLANTSPTKSHLRG